MKHKILAILLPLLLVAGCAKHEQIEFRGRVVWAHECTTSYPYMSYGYGISLEYPEGVGSDLATDEGDTLRNVVVLYEPPKIIRVDNTVSGTFYFDEKYSKANCTWHWDDYQLREGVFTDVKVERQ